MAIELVETQIVAHKVLMGEETVELAAGERLKLKTGPSGQELLSVEVPTGKTWKVLAFFRIEEKPV